MVQAIHSSSAKSIDLAVKPTRPSPVLGSSNVVRPSWAKDEDLAVKPTPLIVDLLLGCFYLVLLLRLIYEFNTDHDLAQTFLLCLVATIIFSKMVAFVALKVGKLISNHRTGHGIPRTCQHPLRTAHKQRKFSDQAWQLSIHVAMTCCELYLLKDNTWYSDPATCFEPCPSDFVASPELRLFYILQLSIWVWTGFSCYFLESRRKDYVEMMLHHCVTIMLVLGSYLNGELAIGLVVLFCHDCSDIVLDLMKIFNYLKMEGRHGYYITELSFGCNLVSWTWYRLYVFPLFVIHRGVFVGYPTNCGDASIAAKDFTLFHQCQKAGTCMQSGIGLSVLAVLHWFWFSFLLNIAYKLLFNNKNASQIGREVYEGLSESDTDTKRE
jgi:hypothetical protein